MIWCWLHLNVIAALTESTNPKVKGVLRASHISLLVYYNKLASLDDALNQNYNLFSDRLSRVELRISKLHGEVNPILQLLVAFSIIIINRVTTLACVSAFAFVSVPWSEYKYIGDAGSTADIRMLWSAMVCFHLL